MNPESPLLFNPVLEDVRMRGLHGDSPWGQPPGVGTQPRCPCGTDENREPSSGANGNGEIV